MACSGRVISSPGKSPTRSKTDGRQRWQKIVICLKPKVRFISSLRGETADPCSPASRCPNQGPDPPRRGRRSAMTWGCTGCCRQETLAPVSPSPRHHAVKTGAVFHVQSLQCRFTDMTFFSGCSVPLPGWGRPGRSLTPPTAPAAGRPPRSEQSQEPAASPEGSGRRTPGGEKSHRSGPPPASSQFLLPLIQSSSS